MINAKLTNVTEKQTQRKPFTRNSYASNSFPPRPSARNFETFPKLRLNTQNLYLFPFNNTHRVSHNQDFPNPRWHPLGPQGLSRQYQLRDRIQTQLSRMGNQSSINHPNFGKLWMSHPQLPNSTYKCSSLPLFVKKYTFLPKTADFTHFLGWILNFWLPLTIFDAISTSKLQKNQSLLSENGPKRW